MYYRQVPRESRVKIPVTVTLVLQILTIVASVYFLIYYIDRPSCEGSGCDAVGIGMGIIATPILFLFIGSLIGTLRVYLLRCQLKKHGKLDKKDARLSLIPIIISFLIIISYVLFGILSSGMKFSK